MPHFVRGHWREAQDRTWPVGDGTYYHAHYGDVIQQFGILAGLSQVLNTFPQADVVGMASDGDTFWISKWTGKSVGTWDPATSMYTQVFTTPVNAGALAWDTKNGVLWVGMQGGAVIPYDATGQQLGASFSPFGNIGVNTVDGLAYLAPQTRGRSFRAELTLILRRGALAACHDGGL